MFRLTREVRFVINDRADAQLRGGAPTNSYAGFPSFTGFGRYLTLAITLEGDLSPHSSYLRNIKEIDEVVRREAIGFVESLVRSPGDHRVHPFGVPAVLMDMLKNSWNGVNLREVRLGFSPYLSVRCLATEHPMVRLSQKFEFAASHRLHNQQLSED